MTFHTLSESAMVELRHEAIRDFYHRVLAQEEEYLKRRVYAQQSHASLHEAMKQVLAKMSIDVEDEIADPYNWEGKDSSQLHPTEVLVQARALRDRIAAYGHQTDSVSTLDEIREDRDK